MRKKEGFTGQKAIVLPAPVLDIIDKNPLVNGLYITDIGFYPSAKFHFRERKRGSGQFILIYCIDGAGWYEVPGKKEKVGAGQFFVLPANVAHRYGSDPIQPWTIYWVHFKGLMAEEIYANFDLEEGPLEIAPAQSASKIKIFEEMYQNLEKGYGRENMMYANMCLWHFLASFLFTEQAAQIEASYQKSVVEKAIDLMQQNINKHLTLDEIATLLNYSVSHFSLLFRKKTGYPPLEYFLQLKIQKSCQYLDFTDMKVKDISLELGWEDPYYFSRLFRKKIGMSPKEYRLSQKG